MFKLKNIINQVHNADCVDFMKQMPDQCIDYCIADFPYNISNLKNALTKKKVNL